MAMYLNIAARNEEEHEAALHEQPLQEEDEAALHDELQLEHHFDLNMDPGTLCWSVQFLLFNSFAYSS